MRACGGVETPDLRDTKPEGRPEVTMLGSRTRIGGSIVVEER